MSVKNRLYFKPLMERSLKHAEFILTVSESSRNELQYFFPQYSEKIRNIGAALPERVYGVTSDEAMNLLKRLRIDTPFLLSVGTVEPRKNLPFTIKSLAPLLKGRGLKLVIAGRSAWGSVQINKLIESENLESNIIRTGYVSDCELQALYSTAEALLFPSLYEGFGLPILEAFACRCPVITSDISSMPEVAGDAAVLIDPTKGETLQNAVEKILTDTNLRCELINRGLKRLKFFSWKKCAQKVYEILDEQR